MAGVSHVGSLMGAGLLINLNVLFEEFPVPLEF